MANSNSPFVVTQELNDRAYHPLIDTYAHPYLDQSPAGCYRLTRFCPGQGMQNPAFMEDMCQLKQDRSPSPCWNVNDAFGSGDRYESRRG